MMVIKVEAVRACSHFMGERQQSKQAIQQIMARRMALFINKITLNIPVQKVFFCPGGGGGGGWGARRKPRHVGFGEKRKVMLRGTDLTRGAHDPFQLTPEDELNDLA
ncbi:unnamed protein product, partial [Dovyalis caffra]